MGNRAVEGAATREDGRPNIFIFHSDPRFERMLTHAVGRLFQIEPVVGWSGLREKLCRVTYGSLAVVDAHAGTCSAKLAPEIRALAWEFPLIPVISVVQRSADLLNQIRCLANWGVDDVVLDSERLPEVIEHVLKAAQHRKLDRIAFYMLPNGSGESARSLVSAAVRVAQMGGGKEELARHFFVSPRTLVRRCKEAGLPPPRRLIGLTRLLIAGELLEDRNLSVVQVSSAAGYRSENAFRRSLKELVDLTPAAIRRAGPLETVLQAIDPINQRGFVPLGSLPAGRRDRRE